MLEKIISSDQSLKILIASQFGTFFIYKEFFVKFYKNAYFSWNFEYLEKPLILLAVQWYSIETTKHELTWPMGNWSCSSDKRGHIWPKFCPPKGLTLLWLKKLQQIHRNEYRIWNPPPIPFIWALTDLTWTKTYNS